MLRIRRILFPTDFSEHANHAWSYGLTFAKEFGAEVYLLHIITPPPRLTEAYAVNFDPEGLVQALRAEAPLPWRNSHKRPRITASLATPRSGWAWTSARSSPTPRARRSTSL